MQHNAAHELYVKMTLAQGALGGFADRGEGVGQNIVETVTAGQTRTQHVRAGTNAVVVERSLLPRRHATR